jgi:hypothetical protein
MLVEARGNEIKIKFIVFRIEYLNGYSTPLDNILFEFDWDLPIWGLSILTAPS